MCVCVCVWRFLYSHTTTAITPFRTGPSSYKRRGRKTNEGSSLPAPRRPPAVLFANQRVPESKRGYGEVVFTGRFGFDWYLEGK